MKITRLGATTHVREKLLEKHGVEWHEVEEVLAQGLHPRRGKNAPAEKRYSLTGRTTAGRMLRVIFALEDDGEARVVTAFDEDKQPRKK
ncbi:MAG TPA: DUF4258 domain-containing protein [Armatimonadota bacterium]|jgi:uncharacterized DUF497 family protein